MRSASPVALCCGLAACIAVLAPGGPKASSAGTDTESQISARIRVPGKPFRVAVGAGFAAELAVGPIHPVVGAGSIWSGSAAIWGGPPPVDDDRVIRIDRVSLAVVEILHMGGNVPGVAFGFGSLWAAVRDGQVVRITAA